jgi:Fungal specific transcription factor domain
VTQSGWLGSPTGWDASSRNTSKTLIADRSSRLGLSTQPSLDFRQHGSSYRVPKPQVNIQSQVRPDPNVELPKTSVPRSQYAPVESFDEHGLASPTSSDGSAEDRDLDAMGCVEGPALGSGLLGSSSGASFMRQIRKAAEGTDTPNQENARPRSNHVSTTLPRLRRRRGEENDLYDPAFVLPPKRIADHLFQVYWDYSDVIFPFLDRDEITRQYARLWAENEDLDVDEKIFYCTLNLMFALATQLDPTGKPEMQIKSASIYYERARTLLYFNLLDISHFEILQALLLAAQYLQSTNMPRQCFQSIGLAVWIAQDLGLHLPRTITSLTNPHDRELARRVWHGCILMDKYYCPLKFTRARTNYNRITAMTFGRPPRISKEIADQAVYPLADGVRSSDGTLNQLTSQPATLDFFIAYCKLHHILGDVLDSFYTAGDGSRTSGQFRTSVSGSAQRLGDLFEIEDNLSRWRDCLEPHLKVPSTYVDRSDTRYITRQAHILHARYDPPTQSLVNVTMANTDQIPAHTPASIQTVSHSSSAARPTYRR